MVEPFASGNVDDPLELACCAHPTAATAQSNIPNTPLAFMLSTLDLSFSNVQSLLRLAGSLYFIVSSF
jgi:hypothetical protein